MVAVLSIGVNSGEAVLGMNSGEVVPLLLVVLLVELLVLVVLLVVLPLVVGVSLVVGVLCNSRRREGINRILSLCPDPLIRSDLFACKIRQRGKPHHYPQSIRLQIQRAY